MDFNVRITKKRTKRRGDDPRLDALADALAEMDEGEGEGREEDDEGSDPKAAPGLLASGGLDEAKAHVARLTPPVDVDHATLERRKVVIEREAALRAARAGSADVLGWRLARRWKSVALAAALVAVLSVGLFVGSRLAGQSGRAEGGSVTAAAESSQKSGGARGVDVMPSMSAPAPAMIECAEPGAAMAGAMSATSAVCSPPRSPTRPVASAQPSARPSVVREAPSTSATFAPPMLQKTPPESISPEF